LGTQGKIFISYRREDAPGDARGLCDRLGRSFGEANVFMDVDKLLAGQRFDRELDKALSKVLVAVIGSRWLELLSEHTQRGKRDYVRDEIAAALTRDIIVIPVMIGHEAHIPPLPRAEDLPENIRDLVLYQKHNITHESFGRDAAHLIAAIKAVLRERRGPRPRWAIAVTGAWALVLTGALLGYWMDIIPRIGSSIPQRSTGTNDTTVTAVPSSEENRAASEESARKIAANEAARKAAEEAQRQADAAKKKAEDEVRQKAEAEAKAAKEAAEQKAANDAAVKKKAADDEAARKAAEGRQAEADADAAKKKAEDEVRQKAEAEAKAAKEAAEQKAANDAAAKKKAADDEAARKAAEERQAEADAAEKKAVDDVAQKGAVTTKAQEPNPPRQVASLPPETAAANPEPSPQDLARLIQSELTRVGCFAGSIDGKWGAASRRSLDMFNKRAGTKFDVKLASIDMLNAIRERTSRICPLICEHGYKASDDDDACTKITCKAGYEISDKNECEKTVTKKPLAARETQRKRTVQHRSGSVGAKCFSVGGKSYCE
jgi:chemotaxis protein histidine kinase CheA